jgi:hypothetical protein
MGIGVKQENEDYFEMQGVDQEEVMKVKQENKGDIEMQDPEEVTKVKQENKADIEMQGVNQEEVMKVEQENEDYFKMQGVNQDDSPPKSLQSQSYRPPPGLLGTFGGPPNSWSRHPKPPPPPPRRSKPPRKPPQSKAPGFNSFIDTAAKPDGLFVPQNTTPTLAQNTITEDNVKMPRDASKPEPRDDEVNTEIIPPWDGGNKNIARDTTKPEPYHEELDIQSIPPWDGGDQRRHGYLHQPSSIKQDEKQPHPQLQPQLPKV